MTNATQASADAISKQSEAAEAVEKARLAQIQEMAASAHEAFVSAMREVIRSDEGGVLLIQRIPLICNDIKWIKWFIMGIAAGIGGLTITLIVFILTKQP